MLVAELYDLACAVAELPVDPVLFKAALKAASDNAGLRDVRLRQIASEDVNVAAGVSVIALSVNVNKLGLVGLRLVHNDGSESAIERIQRANEYRQPLRVQQSRSVDAHRYGAAITPLYRWDQPTLAGNLTLSPAAQEALTVRVLYEPTYVLNTDDAPDWLLYGALEWLSMMVWQDSRQAAWSQAWANALDAASKRLNETMPRRRFIGG